MRKSTFLHCLLGAGLLCLGSAQGQTMVAADYKAAKDHISAEYKAAKAACDSLAGNAKDICVAEAKGKERVAEAELVHNRSGKPSDAYTLAIVMAEVAYDVAKERCDDKAGNDKDVCVTQAKATLTKAKADVKANEKTSDVRTDASEDKRDADYKVAIEKCDSLAGSAKSDCVSAAKVRFGKS